MPGPVQNLTLKTDIIGDQQTELNGHWLNAARIGDLESLRQLESKVDVNVTDFLGNTALIFAADNGYPEIVSYLLSLPIININIQNNGGQSALIIAARNGHETIVSTLVQMPHINLNDKDTNGYTALMWATYNNHDDIVSILSQLPSIDLNAKDLSSNNALMIATFWGYHTIVNILLKTPEIDISVQNSHGETVVSFLRNCPQMQSSVIKKIDELNWLKAAEDGNLEKIKDFSGKININAQDKWGNTALIIAASKGHNDIVKLLLQEPEINVNLQNCYKNSALMLAVDENHENIARMLAQFPGIDINAEALDGYSALMEAALNGAEDIIKILIDIPGIKLDTKPSLLTMIDNAPEVIVLIKNKIDKLTKKAFDAISRGDLKELEPIIAQIGIDKISDHSGDTLVDKAFKANCPEIIEYLLQHAKDPQELLARFPFEYINPTSALFNYFLNLAYSTKKRKKADIEDVSEQSKKCAKYSSPPAHTIESEHHCSLELSTQSRRCGYCWQENCQERCSRCKAVYYCSRECQKLNWKFHKSRCKKNKELP